MKLPDPIGRVKIPKKYCYPGSFMLRNIGMCMDSDEAATRIKDGDYMSVHPISPQQAIGKVVVLNLSTGWYTKQVVRATSSRMVVRYFNPRRTDYIIPISEIQAIYSVDLVLTEDEMKGNFQKVAV